LGSRYRPDRRQRGHRRRTDMYRVEPGRRTGRDPRHGHTRPRPARSL